MGLFDKLKKAASGTELPQPGTDPAPEPALPVPGKPKTAPVGDDRKEAEPSTLNCPQCAGSGYDLGVPDARVKCELCQGSGKVTPEAAELKKAADDALPRADKAAAEGVPDSAQAAGEINPGAGDPPSPELAQCMCGAHLEGECPACNGDPDLVANLQKIGDAAGVNPPAPDTAETAPDTADLTPEPAPADGLTACPYCGKRFKHLTRHKCKKQPEGAPTPAEAVKQGIVEWVQDETPAPGDIVVENVTDGTKEVIPPLPVPKVSESPPEAPEPETPATVPPKVTEPAENPQDDPSVTDCDTCTVEQGDKRCETCEWPNKAPATPAEREPFVLLINAQPIKGAEHIPFAEWIAPLADKVATKFEVPHWGLANFGKGPHALAALVDLTLKDRPLSGVMTLSTFSPEGKACETVLYRHADIIIMGV